MKITRLTIRADVGAASLESAVRLAPALVTPSDGYASFDVQFVAYMDGAGRPTMAPTCEHHYRYTFWRSARKGRYKLAKTPAPTVPAFPGPQGEFAEITWGQA